MILKNGCEPFCRRITFGKNRLEKCVNILPDKNTYKKNIK